MLCTHCGQPLATLPAERSRLPLQDPVIYHANTHWQLARIWCDWTNTTKAEAV